MLSASEEVMMCLFWFVLFFFFSLLCVPNASIALVTQIFHSGNTSLKHASLFHTRDSFSVSLSPQYAVLFWYISCYKVSLLMRGGEMIPMMTCMQKKKSVF